jgi:type IV secretion system protein VirB8
VRDEAAVSEYLAAARGWDADRAQASERSARRAWWIAALATTLAAIAVGAVAALTPLKTVQPYVIRVDRSTGVVDVVPALRGAVPASEAVTRYLVTQYVSARERFVRALAEADYTQVGAFHNAAMNQAWAAAWARSNPESPLVRYADGTTVRAQITAVSFLEPASGRADLVQVRFLREERAGGGQGEPRITHYVATLQYAYGPPSSDDRLRAANPLGFKVLEYRREPEVLERPTLAGAGR